MPEIETAIAALIDDPDFRVIDRSVNRFNLFEAMGAAHSELRHSNFLAYALSPHRPHGLGSRVLLGFLRGVVEALPLEARPVRPLELILGDLDGALIFRERYNIDILIEVRALKLVVVIENKIRARPSDGQLRKYKEIIRREYRDWRHLYVFLAQDVSSSDDAEYIPFEYTKIAEILKSALQVEGVSHLSETSLIVKSYVEMLRRHVVSDNHLRELACRVYERYKEALDFIYDSLPEQENLLTVLKPLLGECSDLQEDHHSSSILRFIPRSWDNLDYLKCVDPLSWTKTGRILIFEIKVTVGKEASERVTVSLVIGPGPADMRKKIYDYALENPSVFKNIVKPMYKQYSSIYIFELISGRNSSGLDFEEKNSKVTEGWRSFVETDLLALRAAILGMPA